MPKLKQPSLINIELVDAYLAKCNDAERVSTETLLATIEANYKRRNEALGMNHLSFGAWMAKDLLGGLLRWSLQTNTRLFYDAHLGDL